jgi:ABC-type dipeptide/oligopeptide/nickel transport system ATPase component
VRRPALGRQVWTGRQWRGKRHDRPSVLVRSIADDVTVLSAGEICEPGPVTQVLSAPSHAYTGQLLTDVPAFEHG